MCDCYVQELKPIERFGIRYGAHAKTCPAYRQSKDPVDRIHDNETRQHYNGTRYTAKFKGGDMAQFQLGSISTGTLRTEDLLPVFAAAVLRLQPETFLQAAQSPYPDDEQLAYFEHILEDLCPPFAYFGALEGDGADFGFWPDWDALDPGLDTPVIGEYIIEECIIQRTSDDVTVLDLERNVIWSTV